MRFEPLPVSGAFRIGLDPKGDDRGVFARTWCLDAFREHGITFDVVQANYSETRYSGTLRGMHHQLAPKPDAKVVRCTRGKIFEVIADVRPDSPTYGAWCPTVLGEGTFHMVYVPAGCAQGFQSITDDVVVEYLMGERYDPTLYFGFRYDDPAIGIEWPLPVSVISTQDLSWPPIASRRSSAAA